LTASAQAGMDREHGMPCWVFRSSLRDELYLYLARQDGFQDLPEALREHFGTPQLVMTLQLHAGRRLAREDPLKVMASLREQGYHLQLPPQKESLLH
jgi:uncharacterized protein YcgL (UPF0745 family)